MYKEAKVNIKLTFFFSFIKESEKVYFICRVVY